MNIFGSGADVNVVEGDYIGTGCGGLAKIGNDLGVVLQAGAVETVIGGSTAGTGDIISGNSGTGVWIMGAADSVVSGNWIGLSSSGVTLGNGGNGVQIDTDAVGTVVGGSSTIERNVISGNAGDGVDISGSGTSGNFVEGNYIGTDSTGSKPVPNYEGVVIQSGEA